MLQITLSSRNIAAEFDMTGGLDFSVSWWGIGGAGGVSGVKPRPTTLMTNEHEQ